MPRLPQPGSDENTWGTILNDFLLQAHNSDGTLKADTIGSSQLSATGGTNGQVLTKDDGVTGGIKWDTAGGGGVPSGPAGGDLGGTYPNPTVPGLAGKENTVTAGTTGQYYRGDKSWQTLDKAAVGLANVDNTSDANKPVSSATQTALNSKENTITAGTTGQYYRGDKSWQTLDKAAVGLANVDNTSDANKPVSSATQTALNLKANTSSLATVATSGDYDDLTDKPTIPRITASSTAPLSPQNGDMWVDLSS